LEKELVQTQQERLKAEAAAASYAKLSKHRAKPSTTTADEGGADDDAIKAGAADARELAQANAKLTEMRIAFEKLKIEATRMHKALVRECGEEVPIDKILSGSESIAPSSHGPAAANLQAQANATGVAALSRFRFSTTASEI
jgi:hypothetical protein